ncbi:RDD family protein [Sorangium sp. So ce693]|uniref:RDD family protein n=1 Tax=Sorangium sp. So ce693 TaxID=3133318 RepID=UPI003F634D54
MSAVSSVASPVPAELSSRIAARGIDVLVLAALDVGLGQLIGFGFDWLILGSALVLAYFSLLDALAGATPGKLALGLRVLGPDGGRPSLKQALIREAFTIVGAVPLAGPLIALAAWTWIALTIRSSPLRQGKHDLFAGGTRVIRVRVG